MRGYGIKNITSKRDKRKKTARQDGKREIAKAQAA